MSTSTPVSRYANLYSTSDVVVAENVPSDSSLGASSVVCLFHDSAGGLFLDQNHLPVVDVPNAEPVACAVEARATTIVSNATIGGLLPLGRLFAGERPAGLAVVATIIGGDGATVDPAAALQSLSDHEVAVVEAGLATIAAGIEAPPQDEIDAVASHPHRHAIHRAAVMPLLKPFSSAILRRAIREEVGDAASVLDVSCGDDELIVSLAAAGRDCVANDVCLNLMKARAAEGASHDVVYTLHNVVQLPFAKRFEAAVCKNTVHHLDEVETVRAFAELDRLADEVVIVDVLDISSSARAKAFNAYYRLFLGDQGRHFLTFEEFSSRISAGFPKRSVRFRQINTVKGRYALAHVI